MLIQEKIINFKTAKLAKEKGFNWETHFWYNYRGGLKYLNNARFCPELSYWKTIKKPINWNNSEFEYSAPEQGLLQKWLRDEHQINIVITYCFETNSFYYTVQITKTKFSLDTRKQKYGINYEESLEFALIYSLNLIKNNNNARKNSKL